MAFSGAKLRQLRNEAGLSREELGIASDLGYWSITRYETYSRIPKVPSLERLAKALGCKVDDLLIPDDDLASAAG